MSNESNTMGCLPMLICNLQVGFILLKAAGFLEEWSWWQVFSPVLVLAIVLAFFIGCSMVGAVAEALGKTERD